MTSVENGRTFNGRTWMFTYIKEFLKSKINSFLVKTEVNFTTFIVSSCPNSQKCIIVHTHYTSPSNFSSFLQPVNRDCRFHGQCLLAWTKVLGKKMMSDSEVTSLPDIQAVESEPEKKPQQINKDDDDEVIFQFLKI